jgi:hypothetical protein
MFKASCNLRFVFLFQNSASVSIGATFGVLFFLGFVAALIATYFYLKKRSIKSEYEMRRSLKFTAKNEEIKRETR